MAAPARSSPARESTSSGAARVALSQEVREFIAEQRDAGAFTPQCDAWQMGWDEQFSRALGARGWIGMTWPTEYGGHGRSALDRFAVVEELLAVGAPIAAHWVADRQMGPSILRYGTEAQKQRFLPAMARGEYYFGIGMSEPDSGSDLASIRTRADRADGGWRLSGHKLWTSGAHHAHALVVLTRTSPGDASHRHEGMSQFIVATDSAGLEVRPVPLLTGEVHFSEVIFDGVFVPDDLVLGTIGSGWQQVTSELAFERSGPERFLSVYPLVPHIVEAVRQRGESAQLAQLGSILARLWSVRQMSLSVAADLAAGVPVDVRAATVKDLGTRFENELVDLARQLLDAEPDPGGGDAAARLLAAAISHAPSFTLRGGTSEILRGVVARALGLR